MSEFERCVDFVHGMTARAATNTVPSPYGVAYLALDVPNVWSRNYLLATNNLATVTAEDLANEAERIMGAAGLAHRKVELVDAEVGDRLSDDFRALAWNHECDVIMVAAREPDREVDTSRVEEVTVDDLVPAWTGGWTIDPAVDSAVVVQQLAENKRALSQVVETRFFAARVNGEIASYCELYSDGSTAQIENVLTLERFRNRGLARATVSHARAEARGHDLIFLIADRDDWPKRLYAKLGFDEVGRIWEFVRPRVTHE